jgi:LysM repeat protein
VRIRRRGRHTAPSQVEKVAEKAGKAAPAMAIAGALVAAPQAQHAFTTAAKPGTVAATGARGATGAGQRQATATTLDSVSAHAVLVSSTSTARHAATGPASNTHYKVKSGDTLSGIAQQYYHKAADWQWLYHENATTISDPNLIYPGETLFVPSDPPANFTLSSYVPKHAKPVTPVVTTSTSQSSGSSDSDGSAHGTATVQAASQGSGTSSHSGSGGLSGTLGCSGLEQLWDSAGGNPQDAFMAAEIAMAESGGNQYAHSPTDDFGYWQINASNGALATYDAYGNARSAIILSDNGTNWSPWTTYTAGLYVGRC